VADESKTSPRKTARPPKTARVPFGPDEAALWIQRAYRRRAGWVRVHAMVAERFERLWDSDNGLAYYWDSATGETSWVAPHRACTDMPVVQAAGDSKRSPRLVGTTARRNFAVKASAAASPEEAAARLIQCAARRRFARRRVRALVEVRFEKLFDNENNHHYYYDAATGDSQWEPPLGLELASPKGSPKRWDRPTPRTARTPGR